MIRSALFFAQLVDLFPHVERTVIHPAPFVPVEPDVFQPPNGSNPDQAPVVAHCGRLACATPNLMKTIRG
jgi:hypothetical protein